MCILISFEKLIQLLAYNRYIAEIISDKTLVRHQRATYDSLLLINIVPTSPGTSNKVLFPVYRVQ